VGAVAAFHEPEANAFGDRVDVYFEVPGSATLLESLANHGNAFLFIKSGFDFIVGQVNYKGAESGGKRIRVA